MNPLKCKNKIPANFSHHGSDPTLDIVLTYILIGHYYFDNATMYVHSLFIQC